VWILLAAATVTTATAATQDGAREQPRKVDSTPATLALPVYKPPALGAPARTIGGGTRGTRTAVILLSVLAPDHVGLTTREQPTLYWYLSEPTTKQMEFTLTDDRHPEPLVRGTLPSAGTDIRRIRLSDYKVRLEPGVRYEWSVALVADTERPSRDTITIGAIERRPAPPTLAADLRETPDNATFLYAAAGIWYDALDAISEAIATRPNDALVAQRAALLEQVGLREVADRTGAGDR
jgi:hypothetical protein